MCKLSVAIVGPRNFYVRINNIHHQIIEPNQNLGTEPGFQIKLCWLLR